MAPANLNTEIVVIGGGVIGLSIARSLALRGVRDITLVERAQVGAEASFAAAGMLAPQAEADANDEFFQLLCRSRDMYREFAAALFDESGIDIELDSTGTLYLAFTRHDEEEIARRFAWQTASRLPVEKLSATEARALEPAISASVRAALRFPADAQVENRRLVAALSSTITRLGVKLLIETEVHSLAIDGTRVAAVKTSRGRISCKQIVVAGGCWSGKLQAGDTSGAPRIEPVRGQMVCLKTKTNLVRHVVYSPRGYLVPRRDGRLLTGSTSEHAGYAKEVTAGGMRTILTNAKEISSAVGGLAIIDSWAGLRPRAADNLPVMGACGEIEGLFYATGHYRNGILLAPVTGELMADTILGKNASSTLVSFSPDRFNLVTS